MPRIRAKDTNPELCTQNSATGEMIPNQFIRSYVFYALLGGLPLEPPDWGRSKLYLLISYPRGKIPCTNLI